MSRSRLQPFFIETSAGRIFLLLRGPLEATRCVLFVPPFGEEMNKCRRQTTETAQRLVAGGYAVLVVDLFGTGDSEGEFVEARWDTWRSNIVSAISWAQDRGLSLKAIVAARLGCLLAAESLKQAESSVGRTVFWQPVDSGRRFMTQFLRLRVAASMMDSGGKETVEGLIARLNGGEVLEIAGYQISPELWRTVDRLELAPVLDPCLGSLAVLEVGRARDNELSIAGKRLLNAASGRGLETSGWRIAGDPFWSSTETVVNPELARRTVEYLTEAS